MTLLSQQNSGFARRINESLARFGSFLRSHSAFSRLQNGFNSLASLWTAWNFREEIFPGSRDMRDNQCVASAANLHGLEPTKLFRHNAPQHILTWGV